MQTLHSDSLVVDRVEHLLSDMHWLQNQVSKEPKEPPKLRVRDSPNAQGKCASISSLGNSARHNLSIFTEMVPPTGGESSLQTSQLLPLPSTSLESYLTPPMPASSTASASHDSCRSREESFSECVLDGRHSRNVGYSIVNG